MPSANSIKDIIEYHQCLGCGACAYVAPELISMADVNDIGLRPQIAAGDLDRSLDKDCLSVCPSHEVDFGELKGRDDYTRSVDKKTEANWSAITGLWEGYAADEEIRFKGSSGGALTAIALYCLEKLDFESALHSAENLQDPIRNSTRQSASRTELLAAVGSRYSPASVCDGLGQLESGRGKHLVIGKPVEIAATRLAMKRSETLAKNIGLTLSFFCAETPPTKATQELMKEHGVSQEGLETLRYRGFGWPGYFVTKNKGEEPKQHWIYQKSWAYLQKFRPWSTQLWPDGSGELADISCGDPWYEEPDGENPGFSLIVARTKFGKEVIQGAMKEGYLIATPAETWKLHESQKGLLAKKGSIWGRRLAQRLMGIPTATFHNLNLFSIWKVLPMKAKLRSTFRSLRRIIQREIYKRRANN